MIIPLLYRSAFRREHTNLRLLMLASKGAPTFSSLFSQVRSFQTGSQIDGYRFDAVQLRWPCFLHHNIQSSDNLV